MSPQPFRPGELVTIREDVFALGSGEILARKGDHATVQRVYGNGSFPIAIVKVIRTDSEEVVGLSELSRGWN